MKFTVFEFNQIRFFCIFAICEFTFSLLNLTFTEFATEGAVKPLTTILPAHRWTHGSSTPPTAHNTLCLFAQWERLLEQQTNTYNAPNF